MEPSIICNVVVAILVNEMAYEHCSSMKQMAFVLFGTWLNNVNSKLLFFKCSFSPHLLVFPYWADDWLLNSCIFPSLSTPTQDGGKEVLSMHQILLYLLRCSKALVPEEEIANMLQWEELEWQKYAEECKGMIVTNPGMVCSGAYWDSTTFFPVWVFTKTVTEHLKSFKVFILVLWVIFLLNI